MRERNYEKEKSDEQGNGSDDHAAFITGGMWYSHTFGQKAYVLLGAHVGYDFGNCNVKLWGRNLTDTKYNTFAVESKAAGQALRFAQRGNPIQLGMDVNIHF